MNNRWTPWLFMAPALSLILAVTIYPMIYSMIISFQDVRLARINQADFVGFANYARLLVDSAFHHSLLLSILYVVGSVIGSLLLGLALALLFDRELYGMVLWRSLLIVPMVVTPVSIGLTWRMMYSDQTGVINFVLGKLGLPRPLWIESPDSALFSVMLVDIWEWTPFMFLILLAGLRSLPLSPFESARVDGASAWQRFFYLTLPMLSPVIAVAVLLRAIDALRIFDQVFIMTRGGPAQATDLFSLFLYRTGFKHAYISYAAALSWVLLILTTVLLVFFVRVTGVFRGKQEIAPEATS
jgi:multiple sugar transport system permease protein